MKNLAKDCSLCKANLEAWMGSLNLDKEREEAMRRSHVNYCPMCRFYKEKLKRK